VKKALGPEYDVEKHFSPRYNPWDQRLCLIPDADLFLALRSGKASVVTDEIASFTEKGLRLQSGDELEADIIVTATGLKLKLLGGMELMVDGCRSYSVSRDDLQRHDVQRNPEPRFCFWIHQRILDAESRSDRGVRMPLAEVHGRARLRLLHAAPARSIHYGGARG